MLFNLNILLIYLIIILIIYYISYSDNNCYEKLCITTLLLILFHISINYLYNENFTNTNTNKNTNNIDKFNFLLTKNDVLYIINIVKNSNNDDKLKVNINSSLYYINLLNKNLASDIGKVIYISLIDFNKVENMINNNYNSFIDLIKSIDNITLPEKIIITNSNNININNNDNVFYKILQSNNLSFKTLPLNINNNTNTIKQQIINTNQQQNVNTNEQQNVNTNQQQNVNTNQQQNVNTNNDNNNNDILNNLKILKNTNLDNYDTIDIKQILNKLLNENNDKFKKSLNEINNNDLKYNQINNNLMKPLGYNDDTLSNKFNMSNEYTLLNTNRWTLQDNNQYKCKQTCDICPLTDTKYTLLKNYDQTTKVLNPDNINIDYIKEKLNQI